MVKVAQCWDDGVLNDIKLTDLLRKYGAKATFNLNPALHYAKERFHSGWKYKDYSPGRLAWNEVTSVYEGFDVASHTMCHCNAGMVDDKVFFAEAVMANIAANYQPEDELPDCMPDYAFNPDVYEVPPMEDEAFDAMLMSELNDVI